MSSGRKRGLHWIGFTATNEGEKHLIAQCDACKVTVSARSVIMVTHKRHCTGNSDGDTDGDRSSSNGNVFTRSGIVDLTDGGSGAKRRQTCLPKAAASQIDSFQKGLVKWVVSSNTPFSVVENRDFRDWIATWAPHLPVPSRQKVGGELLEQLYESTLAEATKFWADKKVTMMIDGWTAPQNNPVVGVSIVHGGAGLFVAAIDTETNRHNGQYMAKLAVEQIATIQETLRVKVTTLVTDGAANMIAMHRELEAELAELEMPRVLAYRCQAHALNLFAKDVVGDNKDLVARCTSILKHFRQSHILSSMLRERGINRPVIHCETRWNSAGDSLAYMDANWHKLLEVARDVENDRDVKQMLRFFDNAVTAVKLRDLVQVFRLIGIGLDRMQSASATLADAVDVWLDLGDSLARFHNEDLERRYRARRDECLNVPCFTAAYLMHPRHKGRRLSAERVREAKAFIVKDRDEVLNALNAFLAEDEPYDEGMQSAVQQDDFNPTGWWKAGRRTGFDHYLVDKADTLLGAATSSAALERHFSTLGFTYGDLRNRLAVNKAGKLTLLYKIFRSKW